MRTDTEDPASQDTRSQVRLRVRPFTAMWAAVGKTTPEDIAAELGMSTRQLRRAKNGAIVGPTFMAATITGLSRHAALLADAGLEPTLDTLFEVVEP